MPKTLKPGQKAPASGQYKIIGSRGGDTGRERTVVKGEPLPPPPKPGQQYQIADRTKIKVVKGKKGISPKILEIDVSKTAIELWLLQ